MPTVHVLSVHHKVEHWVSLQRRYLDKYVLAQSDRTFIVDGIDTSMFTDAESLVSLDAHPIDRFEFLSALFSDCDPDDWIFFIDSDAFILTDVEELLSLDSDMIAIQRTDNGDWHPHPSFTLVRAGLWHEIGSGAWNERSWINARGTKVSEMGGELLHRVNEMKIPWIKLTRVNKKGLHPLWFGVYGLDGKIPVAYHHGAGSRTRVSRSDLAPKVDLPKVLGERFAWAIKRSRNRRFGLTLRECVAAHPATIDQAVLNGIKGNMRFWELLL